MRRRGLRRGVVAGVVVLVLVLGRAAPAGAFLSALDPAGWAVVAQMAAIISQAIAIKRQVENVRNQARAEFFGKLAPLTGKLTVVAGWLRNARSRAAVSVYNPASHTAFLPPDSLPAFNRPMEECAGGAAGPEPCMPPISAAALPASLVGNLSAGAQRAVASGSGQSPVTRAYGASDAQLRAAVANLQRRAEDLIVRQDAGARRAGRRVALNRALVDEQMAIVEDWRGCQEAQPGAWAPPPPAVDDRMPCMTHGGLGRGDPGGGTQGAQADLAAKLDALERYQDGDVSKVQLDTMQTQLIVMLGRLQAARAGREAAALEAEQEARMAAEAARRRNVERRRQDFECKVRFGVHSYFIESYPATVPPTGACLQVRDVSAAAMAAAASSCLLAGRCS